MVEYSLCESAYAGPQNKWHIRKLTDVGPKFGGGIDTPSLCGLIGPPQGNGWDINVDITEHHLDENVCKHCHREYRLATY